MENRDRDKVSRSDRPTEAGDINRETESRKDKSGPADFGGNIGRSEDLIDSSDLNRSENSDDSSDRSRDLRNNENRSGRSYSEH